MNIFILICACIMIVMAMLTCTHIFIYMCSDLKENLNIGKTINANFLYYFLHVIPFIVSVFLYLFLIGCGTLGIIEIINIIAEV